MNTEKITIEAEVRAPMFQVWEAYTNAEHIVHWNFASDDWCCPSATVDFKVGGKHSARMEAKDGSFGFDFEYIYTEIEMHRKISYKMLDDRNAEVQFKENADATIVTVCFDAENQNPIDMQKQGWQAILNNFKKYAENL